MAGYSLHVMNAESLIRWRCTLLRTPYPRSKYLAHKLYDLFTHQPPCKSSSNLAAECSRQVRRVADHFAKTRKPAKTSAPAF
jgi:hypothetical protein